MTTKPKRPKYPEIGDLLPIGRLVRGSLSEQQTKNHKNEPLPPEEYHYWFAVAIPKNATGLNEKWAQIWQHTNQVYQTIPGSQGVLAQLQMGLAAPAFAWKIDDGDTDPKWSQREGCPGCLVFQFKTFFTITCGDDANRQLDPAVFKLGDYVQVYFTTSPNGEVGHTAGVHMNPRGVRWIGEGQRITVGPDLATMFGAATGQGYLGHQQSNPMPAAVTHGVQAPAPAPTPAPMPPAAPPAPQPVAVETAQMQAARLGIQYHPGWRFQENPSLPGYGGYVQDVPPQPPVPNAAPMAAPAPTHAYGSGASVGSAALGGVGYATGAGNAGYPLNNPMPQPGMAGAAPGMGAPAGGPGMGAVSAAAGMQTGIAYPSNQPQYTPHNPPPVQPVAGFSTGAPQIR